MCSPPYAYSIFANRRCPDIFYCNIQAKVKLSVFMLFLKEEEMAEWRRREKWWNGGEQRGGLVLREILVMEWHVNTTSVSTTACYCSAGAVWHPSISALHATHTCTHKHGLSRTICPHGSFIKCPYLYTEINGTNSTLI